MAELSSEEREVLETISDAAADIMRAVASLTGEVTESAWDAIAEPQRPERKLSKDQAIAVRRAQREAEKLARLEGT